MKTKIIVIDDHPLMRQGIIATLRNEYDLDIVGEADCGKAALEMAPRLSPDIVLLDLNQTKEKLSIYKNDRLEQLF